MTKGALFLIKPLKTRTFNNIEDTWIQNLKHGTTIEQTGIYDIYDASKVIANYNQPLPENDSTISDILSFPDIFKENNEDYENVSHDFESFFINITAKETNYYILHENKITEPRMLNILD